MHAVPAFVILTILLAPYTLMNIHAQEEVLVEIAVGAKTVDNNKFYVPTKITVPVGGTVVWENLDDAAHTVTSGTPTCPGLCWGLDFESGIMRLDDVYKFTFDQPGVYPYLCSLHPWMIGTVIVGEGQEIPSELSIEPDKTTYKVGDNVILNGSVSMFIEGMPLMIEVLNPNNESVVFELVSVGIDGAFNFNFKLTGSQFIPGSYTVRASYSDAQAETLFVVEEAMGGEIEVDADVRVAAKQIRDLLIVRIRNAQDSGASLYGITIETSDSIIQAFRGPRSWHDGTVTSNEVSSSVGDEPLNPGEKTYLKLKVGSDDFVISWIAYGSNDNIIDEGDAKPIRR